MVPPRAFRASAIKNSVRSPVLSRRQDRRSLGRHAERVSRFRSVPSQGTPLVHWLERRDLASSKRGPPGTRRAPSAAADSFGASVRTRSAYLLRTDGRTKGGQEPGVRVRKIYSRVDEFRRWRNDRVFGPIAGRPIGRSILRAHWFGNGVIWSEEHGRYKSRGGE